MTAPFQPLLKYADAFAALAKDFAAIQTNNLTKFNALQKEAMVTLCDSGTAQLHSVRVPTNYQEWLDAQTKLLGDHSAKAQKLGTDYLKLFEEGQTELAAWLQRSAECVTQSANDILKTKAA